MLRPVLIATAALALAAAPAFSAPGAREASAPYATPGGVTGVISGDTDLNGSHYGAALVTPRRGESRVEVSVADTTGLPVSFELAQDVDGDGRVDWKTGGFCGRTSGPVRLAKQRVDVLVLVNAGQCGAGVSAPTTGTVTARFSYRRAACCAPHCSRSPGSPRSRPPRQARRRRGPRRCRTRAPSARARTP
jgi:hypothetical protein